MSLRRALRLLVFLLALIVSGAAQTPIGSGSQPARPNTATTSDSKPQPLMTTGQAVAQSIIDAQDVSPPPLIFLPQSDTSSSQQSPPYQIGTPSGSTMQSATQASPWADVVSQAATSPFGLLFTGSQGLASAISNRVQEDPSGAVIDTFALGSAVIAPAFPSSELAISIHSLGEDTLISSGLTFAHAGIQGADHSDAANTVGGFALDTMGAGTATKAVWDTLFTLGSYFPLQSTSNPENAGHLGSSGLETSPIQPAPTSSGLSAPFTTVDPTNTVTVDPPGIAIDSQIVPDSTTPASGITIETGFVQDPSNDGMVVEAPSTPILIESSLIPDPASRPMDNLASGGSHFDWGGFLSDALPVAGAILQGIAAPPANARTQKPAPTMRYQEVCAGMSAVDAAKTPYQFLVAAGALRCKMVPANKQK